MSEIGKLFSPHLLEEAVLSALQRRLPLYMDEAANQYGLELPEIVSWGLIDEEEDRKPEQGLPALIVIAGGIGKGGEPEENSDAWYRAAWGVQVDVIVDHPEMVMARKIAQIYGAVIRGALVQERSLTRDGFRIDWTGELNPYRGEKSRTEAASNNFFLVTVEEVVNWRLGPKGDELPAQPPGNDPEVTEVDVSLEVDE
jgi:hypothetical protein